MNGYLILVFWLMGIIPTFAILHEETNMTKFNKVWLSLFWPATLMLFGIHKITKLFQ